MKQKLSFVVALLASAALAGCGERDSAAPANSEAGSEANAVAPPDAPRAEGGWEMLSSGEGSALRFAGTPGIHLFCPSESGRLFVNVASFKPIASEERLSLGSGDTVVATVADSNGDALRGGVTGETPVPAELAAILAGAISVSYGAQSVGPVPAPARSDRAAFLAACGQKVASPAPATPATPKPTPATAAACQMQGETKLAAMRLRAIGTEPFWGARIDGRCVTYSTPEDQAGTRVWTRFSGTAEAGTWSGSLGGRQFELRTRKQAGCSDGMSDNRYPIAVVLRVGGETRRGCAEPA